MEPKPHAASYADCVAPPGTDGRALSPVVTVAESEGLTLVLTESQALQAGYPVPFRTGVSCNVVAGAFHDHLFVPVEQANAALSALRALQQEAPACRPA